MVVFCGFKKVVLKMALHKDLGIATSDTKELVAARVAIDATSQWVWGFWWYRKSFRAFMMTFLITNDHYC